MNEATDSTQHSGQLTHSALVTGDCRKQSFHEQQFPVATLLKKTR